MERSSINSKNRNLAFYLEKINDFGFEVECIKIFSTAGDILPPYPFQYQALTKLRLCDEDVIDATGSSPLEAVKNLYKYLRGIIDIYMPEEEEEN